jgi:hypothetical protein
LKSAGEVLDVWFREEDTAMIASSLVSGREGRAHSFDENDAARREIAGVPQLHLEEIGKLPDERLFRLIPVVASEVQIYYDDGNIAARFVTGDRSRSHFPAEGPENELLHQVDGVHSLQQICDKLASQDAYRHQPAEEVRRTMKGFMLELIERRVCLPLQRAE